MNERLFRRAIGIMVLAGFCQFGFSRETLRGYKSSNLLLEMDVVEPNLQVRKYTPNRTNLMGLQSISDASREDSRQRLQLSPREEQRALLQRLDLQKKMRKLKAKSMAKHRRIGGRVWKREMESFLTEQKKIRKQISRTKRKPSPMLEPPAQKGEEKAMPLGHSILA